MEKDLFTQDQPDQKKAIVVGATSGIGRALAQILVQHNYRVGITGRREHLLKELREENARAYVYRAFDIRDLSKTTKNLRELIKELGGLDLLILSSGVGYINEDLDAEPEFQTIDTNITAFTDIMTFTFKFFQKQGNGHIVGITSVGALQGSKNAPAYCASKAYQAKYLEGLRQKACSLHLPLYITDIRPGFADTDMAKGDKLFWVTSPGKAARQIFRAIQKKKRVSYITKRWKIVGIIIKLLSF